MTFSISSVSREYAYAKLTSDVALDTQTIELAFLGTTESPSEATSWLAAEWAGSAGTTREARILIGPTTTAALAPQQYAVWSRLSDTTEQIVRKHDVITIL